MVEKRKLVLVIGPRNSAPQRFKEWFTSENFQGLSTEEIASLAFDAGHAFWHETEDVCPNCNKEKK